MLDLVAHLLNVLNPTGLTSREADEAIAKMNDEANRALRDRITAFFDERKIPSRVEVEVRVTWETRGLRR